MSLLKANLWCLIIIFLILLCSVQMDRLIDNAKSTTYTSPAKKYHKKLKKENGAIRLVGGITDNEGNVEILHHSKWGNICDDEWDSSEGQVICNQLGFDGLKRITHSGYFGAARRRYWMDNIQCTGNETEISECRFEGWGKNDCEASEAAGVVCAGGEMELYKTKLLNKLPKHRIHKKYGLEIRLSGGRNKCEGQVEVRLNKLIKKGHWGGLCADGWSLLEANVICKQLGLGYASHAMQTDIFSDEKLSKILISGTECYGNETTLQECMHHELGNVICPGDQSKVAAVICVDKIADLVFDHTELAQSAHLADVPLFLLQCAMEENCLASRAYEIQRDVPDWHMETRRLLKFTARTLNAGNADFRPSIPKHLWEWHLCHQHYHSMEVFATFNIFNSTGYRVAEGHKASFCLEDNQCLPNVKARYACADFGDQGISVNCSDIYRHTIDCQWVDISEMEIGTYTIKISINPEFKVGEMTFDNNAARCTLLYTETYARIFDCHLERP